MTLSLVHDNTAIREARLHQELRESQQEILKTASRLMDSVLETLPEQSRACLWLVEAIELVERSRLGISG